MRLVCRVLVLMFGLECMACIRSQMVQAKEMSSGKWHEGRQCPTPILWQFALDAEALLKQSNSKVASLKVFASIRFRQTQHVKVFWIHNQDVGLFATAKQVATKKRQSRLTYVAMWLCQGKECDPFWGSSNLEVELEDNDHWLNLGISCVDLQQKDALEVWPVAHATSRTLIWATDFICVVLSSLRFDIGFAI